MRHFTASNIEYDTDGESVSGLPTEMEIDVPTDEFSSDEEILDYIENQISVRTGFCHLSFTTEPKLNV